MTHHILYWTVNIMKTSSTDPSGKNKIVYELLSQPHRQRCRGCLWGFPHLCRGKLKKTTQGSNPRLTAPINPTFQCQTQCRKVIPHTNLCQQETLCIFGRSTFWYFKLQWMSYSRSSDMSNSGRRRWKLTEQTMIRVRIHLVQQTQSGNMKSMTQWQETLINAKNGSRIHMALEKLKVIFSCRSPHRRTIHEDRENKCIIATK